MHLESELKTYGNAVDLFYIPFREPFKEELIPCFMNTFPGMVISREEALKLIAGQWDDEFGILGFWDHPRSLKVPTWSMHLDGISSKPGLFALSGLTHCEVTPILDEVTKVLEKGIVMLRGEDFTPAEVQIHPDIDRLLPQPFWFR